jgi:hypothetical protein
VNPPAAPPDPDLTQRALDVAEWSAKLAAAAAAVWAIVEKVGKPYAEWRRRQLAAVIRDVLKEPLAQLEALDDREKEIFELLTRVLARQDQLFRDIDAFITIATTNKDRLDEMNELLDALGFSSERRMDVDRRERVEQLLRDLSVRQTARKRFEDLKENHDA